MVNVYNPENYDYVFDVPIAPFPLQHNPQGKAWSRWNRDGYISEEKTLWVSVLP